MAGEKTEKKKKMTKKVETATDLTHAMLSAASRMAGDVRAAAVLIYCDAVADIGALPGFFKTQKLLLLAKSEDAFAEAKKHTRYALMVPNIALTRVAQMKFAITIALTAKFLNEGDKIVCLSGIANSGVVDNILCIRIGEEQEMLTSAVLSFKDEQVPHEVFGMVLNIALALAHRGREGKPVGTIFVIGDTEEVLRFSSQMILNPFRGYSEEEKTIFKEEMGDTLKELASLDGAFIIDSKGIIQAAGRHLKAALSGGLNLPQGLGARHHAAAGISQATNAIAIVISETTGKVTIFKSGQILTEIEKPPPHL